MALMREWVRTDRGDYLVLAGTTEAVGQEGEDQSALAGILAWTSPLWMLARRQRRRIGRGRVEVRWLDEVIAWTTPNERSAHAAARHAVELVRSGAWVPKRTPQPDLPGAEQVF